MLCKKFCQVQMDVNILPFQPAYECSLFCIFELYYLLYEIVLCPQHFRILVKRDSYRLDSSLFIFISYDNALGYIPVCPFYFNNLAEHIVIDLVKYLDKLEFSGLFFYDELELCCGYSAEYLPEYHK